MPQIGNKKYPYTKEGLARYKHDLRKLADKKKKIQKQYGMSANMDQFQFADVSGVPAEFKKMLKGEKFDPSNPRHVALMLKFKKIKARGMEKHLSANMNHLISLEAKMDDSFEFYAQPQKKKEGSALGTATKVGVGALGAAGAYGLASAARGDSLKGGGLMSGVKDTKGIGNKLGQVKKNFAAKGGAKGLLGRTMGVMKRDKNKLIGGVRRLFGR